MEREVIEHNKVRCIRLDTGYTYQESVKDEQTGEFVEMIDIVKESDYSIFYMNFTGEEKIGIFHIESDSLFIEPFRNLVLEDQEFRILDDYSDRYVSIFKEENGGVTIEVHLLPGEFDASIELKNIMFDLRCKSDSDGLDTKKRLSTFFDELVKVYDRIPELEQQKLVNKMSQNE